MGSRKRGRPDLYENGFGHPSSKSQRGSGYPGRRFRFSPGLPPLLESLEDALCERAPVWPLLLERGDELERALGGAELSRPDVLCLIRALGQAAAEAPGEGEVRALLQPLLRSPFLGRDLLWFLAGIGQGDGEAVGEAVTLLRHLTRAAPEAVRPLLHVPADLLRAKVQRLRSQGYRLPWPTRKRLSDLGRAVDAAFPGDRDPETPFSEERPRDIQALSVFPTPEELLGFPDPWVLPNTVEGPYASGRAYLDAQFRLLREDFVGPLRERLATCLSCEASGEPQAYRDVRVLHPDCQWEGVTYKARLGPVGSRPGGRLVKGSLVCLFAPDCEEIFPAAVAKGDAQLLARGYLWLRFAAGHRELSRHLYRHSFSMVESPAFFEAYLHVLRGLQEMDAKRIPFQRYVVACKGRVRPPQYLPPHGAYLDMRPLLKTGSRAKRWDGPEEEAGPTQEQGMEWDRAEASEKRDCPEAKDWRGPPAEVEGRPADQTGHPAAGADGPEEGEKVPGAGHPWPAEEFISIAEPLAEEGGSWADGVPCLQQTGMETTPSVQHTKALPGQVGSPSPGNKYLVNPFQHDLHSLRWLRHFDRSQLKALQKALTREFAIIQGPPGTGKTYIGLKLVQLLLHNARLWQAGTVSGQDTPILIVCNTNHTLDLFLEGLLESNCSKIVRIGGFCKNKRLENFTLENLRKTRLHAMLTPLQRHRFKEIKKKIEDTKGDIVYCSKVLEMLPLGILQDDELAPEMKADVEELGLPSIPLSNWKRGVLLEWLKIPLHLRLQTDTDRRPAPGALGTDWAQDGVNPTLYFSSRPSQEVAPTVNSVLATSHDDEGEWEADGGGPRDPPCSAERWAGGKFAYLASADTRDGELAVRRCLSERSVMSAEEVRDIDSVWELPLDHRWRLYRRWRAAYQDKLNASMNENLELYESLAQDLQALELEETLMLLGEAEVISMTTLGTARYRTLLQHIRPRIVVFEEAAEVLEAQVLTTLTPDCQHLIMIGDHRQLRPKVADHRNAAKMRLDVSLFERMVSNQIPFVQLSQQHRMRPEISQLMVPMFYPSLKDHRSVTRYEDVRGMVNNVFFLQHQESEARGAASGGHVNEHEARLLVGLSRHLLGQGYSPGQLTLLAPYAAQLQRIRALAAGLRLRVRAVDDFQGQESDIVLLSLVRGNREGRVGFLRDKNRLLVALSRARVGFYCAGDLQNLRRGPQGAAWDGFLQLLRDRGLTGEALPLVCPRHPRGRVLVRAPQDFPQPWGCGCSEGHPRSETVTRQCERASCGRECDQPCA